MRSLWRWISALGPVALYAALIVHLSGRSRLPSVGVNDKVAHFVEYAVLAFLVTRALALVRPGTSLRVLGLVAVGLATLFGLTDELHQHFVPNRDASLYDLLADFAGSVAGAMAYAAWADLRDRLARRLPSS